MALSTSQYVRRHTVTVAVANWGIVQTHLHNLNAGAPEGGPTGYTPNLVTVSRAYITDTNNVNRPINPSVVSIVGGGLGVSATTFSFIIGGDAAGGAALRDAFARKNVSPPVSLTFEAETRFAHSVEIGTTAVSDEVLAAATVVAPVPMELSDVTPSNTLEDIYVDVAGLDTNSGRTLATPFLTIQRACDDIMAMSPLHHDVLVHIGPGLFAGNWTLDGVELCDGASVYFVGAAPATPVKTSVSAGGAAFAASPRDHGHIRLSPDAAWDVVPAAADIGRTLRISNGVFVAYATIGQISTSNVPGANCYIDLVMDPVLTGAAPAWTIFGGTTYEIIDQTAADVTHVDGEVNIFNVKKGPGSAASGTGAHTAKHNLLGNIRFRDNVSFTAVATNGSDRFSFHGSRFERGLIVTGCRDCTSTTNSVPTLGLARYWPTAVWVALGYGDGAGGTIAETNDAYGGCGSYVVGGTCNFQVSDGIVQGLVMGGGQQLIVGANADVAFASCSFEGVLTQLRGACSFTYTRFAGQLATDTDGKFLIGDYNTWAARAGAFDDTIINAPVNLNTGMISIAGSGKGFITLNAADRLEGHNSALAAANNGNVVVRCITGGTLYWTGGHDANLYGEGGFLVARDATIYMSGDRAMAAKGVATAAHEDWNIGNCRVRSIGDITRTVADFTPGAAVRLNWASEWIHGDVGTDTGLFQIGDGAGTGIDCGNEAAVVVEHSSTMVIGVPRIANSNVGAGANGMDILYGSHVHAGTAGNVNDAYVLATGGGGGVNVQVGTVAFAAANPLAVAVTNDLPAAPAGNEHLSLFNVE